jgi:hypothetical protein
MTSWIRSSLRRKGTQAFAYSDRDLGPEYTGRVIAETFERHWHQLRGIAAHNVSVALNYFGSCSIGGSLFSNYNSGVNLIKKF